ncbi:MAG: 6-phosphogluconolactonase [Anaeromyxobacter sp.]
MAPPALEVHSDPAAVAQAAAAEVARRMAEAVAARGRFTLALAGGSTPRALYERLADPAGPYRTRLPWGQVTVWFGDERCVPPDHPDSNYRMAHQALLRHVAAGAVHRLEGERPPPEAANRYEAHLRRELGEDPALDLVLLGLGPDGHTASLFPGSPALEERQRWVAAPFVPHLGAQRLTLTYPVLDAARAVLFVVSGAEKAPALAQLLSPAAGAPLIPAARIRASGEQRVLADEAAAGRRAG